MRLCKEKTNYKEAVRAAAECRQAGAFILSAFGFKKADTIYTHGVNGRYSPTTEVN